MNILVCGGAGYIGSHMCRRLADSGHEVAVFDNLSTGHAEAVRWGRLIRGDLLRREDIEQAFRSRQFDAVMHFCAKALVGESMIRPDLYYQNKCHRDRAPAGRHDRARRQDVHLLIDRGDLRHAARHAHRRRPPQGTDQPLRPHQAHGGGHARRLRGGLRPTQRLAALLQCRRRRARGRPRRAARAGDAPDPQYPARGARSLGLPPRDLRCRLRHARRDLHPRLHPRHRPVRSAHARALDYLRQGGKSEVFNLGNGRGFSVLEVIRAAEAVTGRKISYTIAERRPGDPAVLVASAAKAGRVLSWTPRYTDLAAIIDTAWRWHRAQAPGQ